jgi:SAM-dependent methyltransferase
MENITTIPPFIEILKGLQNPKILNVGSRAEGRDTLRQWAPHAAEWVGIDIQGGPNVELIGNIENAPELQTNYFDVVISKAAFEHIARPWKAAAEIARVLKPGGYAWIHSHHSFPIHGHPFDYWRYTTDAFKVLFVEDHGFEYIQGAHDVPCIIDGEITRDGFIHTSVILRKAA